MKTIDSRIEAQRGRNNTSKNKQMNKQNQQAKQKLLLLKCLL